MVLLLVHENNACSDFNESVVPKLHATKTGHLTRTTTKRSEQVNLEKFAGLWKLMHLLWKTSLDAVMLHFAKTKILERKDLKLQVQKSVNSNILRF